MYIPILFTLPCIFCMENTLLYSTLTHHRKENKGFVSSTTRNHYYISGGYHDEKNIFNGNYYGFYGCF